jgi:hypothetical protein
MTKGYAIEAYRRCGDKAQCILDLALDGVKRPASSSGHLNPREKASGAHRTGGQLALPELIWM